MSEANHNPSQSGGRIEATVRVHNPSASVLYESNALDRELSAEKRSWPVLLRAIESFYSAYPAILLRSVDALQVLGKAGLQGMGQAPSLSLRVQSATLTEGLFAAIVEEIMREGPENTPEAATECLETLLAEMVQMGDGLREFDHLLPALLDFGRQILLIGEDGCPAASWSAMLLDTTRMALRMQQWRIEAEPVYDGRWDQGCEADLFELPLLADVRKEQLQTDLDWLHDLMADLASTERPVIDVLLELAAYRRAQEREQVWETWFAKLNQKFVSQAPESASLRCLCEGFADWIGQTRDLRLFRLMASVLRNRVPAIVAAGGEAGLVTALDTVANAVMDRLQQEAGRGEIEPALEDLRAVAAEILQRLLGSSDISVVARTVAEAQRLRTGPIQGAPVSREDVSWRLGVSNAHPDVAEKMLLPLVVGFSLEEVWLRDEGPQNQQDGSGEPLLTVGQALVDMLSRSWPGEMIHLLRTVVRLTPLSPFHLGAPTMRAHLLALDPEDRQGSYLHDLKERVLSGGGRESLLAVESVLRYWLSGDVTELYSLACPESLAALPAQAERERVPDIREILTRLRRHAPSAKEDDVAWLARLPATYFEEGTLLKLAGFPGCSNRAVPVLLHLLEVYRSLYQQGASQQKSASSSGRNFNELLVAGQEMLSARRQLQGLFFKANDQARPSVADHLQTFADDRKRVQELDRILEEGIGQDLQILDREQLADAGRIFAMMLRHAQLSGMSSVGDDQALALLDQGQMPAEELATLLQSVSWQLTTFRNQLAAKLQPYVEDSTQRLLENPLARPAAPFREVFIAYHQRGAERMAVRLGELLVDELLAADGGILLLESFTHRLLHFMDRY